MNEYPEQIKSEAKGILYTLLSADDVIRMKFRKGELTRKEASKIGGNIAATVDGIILEAMKDEELAEEIIPILADKIENGKSNPLPYTHLLQVLAYRHELEVKGEVQNPKEILETFKRVESEMDLDNLGEEKARLEKEFEEEFEEKAERRREEQKSNLMFG